MAKKVAEYIESNDACFRTFKKHGLIPCSVVRQFEIYIYYIGLTNPSKMQKYEDTATAMRSNTRSVINAVKAMERSI